jgi:hypothetical protein
VKIAVSATSGRPGVNRQYTRSQLTSTTETETEGEGAAMERATEEEEGASEGRPRGRLGTTTPQRGLVVRGPGAAPKHTHTPPFLSPTSTHTVRDDGPGPAGREAVHHVGDGRKGVRLGGGASSRTPSKGE